MMLRKLKIDDVFPMFQILNKIGFKNLKEKINLESVQKIAQEAKKDKKNINAAVGFDVVMEIAFFLLEGLPKAKDEIYSFLASLSGATEQEIAELSPADFMDMIVELLQKEEFKDFFKVVSKLFK